MKISLKWLNQYVDVSDYFSKPEELGNILTAAGLEVEEMKNNAQDLKHVVVGFVQLKDKHPNADKLSLCQVEIAPGKIEQIVCGAQNHKTGDKVVVALPGAVLPGNFAIKKSKIRDVESNGMLCSFKELGQTGDSQGIIILPADAKVGLAYSEYAGLDDVTFELKVTPNRADCLSHYGLAREIGCLLNRPVKSVETQTQFVNQKTKDKVNLTVNNQIQCIRYSGRYIKGVKISESPAWLKQKLESVGLNPINNVVDVTNFVMHELGQPLHAFDADKLAKNQIVVRTAEVGEKFKTLKDQDLILKGDELLICDGEKAVALAGVIGGLNSGVSEQTQNIFIESANFESQSVRKSSRSHGIETDSAYRFSRGVDPSQTLLAMDRAALLIQQIAGGEVYGDHYDVYPKPVVKAPVRIAIQTVSDRLGYQAQEELFVQYMKGLHCKIEKSSTGVYDITPPLFRFDLEQDMDLVEEYARLFGYDNIAETLPALHVLPSNHDAKYTFNQNLSHILKSAGFSQAFNYAFTSLKDENAFVGDKNRLDHVGLKYDDQSVLIKNPLSEDLNSMRRLLAFPLWINASENIHGGNNKGQLFEIGSVFHKNNDQFMETTRLSAIAWGSDNSLFATKAMQVINLRTLLEKLFLALKITSYSFKTVSSAPSFLHAGQVASVVVEGKTIGFIGSLHPALLAKSKIREDVAVLEINIEGLLQVSQRPVKFKSLPVHPHIERDFSFMMSSEKHLGDLLADIKKAVGSAATDLKVFDIYQGDKLPSGQKSASIKVCFQPQDNVFTDKDIQDLMSKVVASAEKFGAQLR